MNRSTMALFLKYTLNCIYFAEFLDNFEETKRQEYVSK